MNDIQTPFQTQLINDGVSLAMANALIAQQKSVLILPIAESGSKLRQATDQELLVLAKDILKETGGELTLPITGIAANIKIQSNQFSIRSLHSVPEGTAAMLGLERNESGKYKNYLTGRFDLGSARKSFWTFWINEYHESSWDHNPMVVVIDYIEPVGIEPR
ncbi:MAG TPA: hypothetical protein DCS93_16915 [Microscillaceae bacterium]|nr:hypothetical protein [Microscillaceae bacterium]